MSIIQQIREKYAAVGIAFIALSLIGFILMDSTKNNSGGIDPNDAIGEVDGRRISYNEFIKQTAAIEDMQKSSGRNVDEELRQQINTEVWRQLVEETLMTGEYEKLGLVVTDKEFNDLLFGDNPPPFLTQQFTNPETGKYDAAAARKAIADLKKNKANPNIEMIEEFYLKPLIEQTLREKYNALLGNSAFVPSFMAQKTLSDNNAVASFRFVNIPYNTIADSLVKVSDEAIRQYVSERKREFKQEEKMRSISYVSFPFNASAQDSAEVLNELLRLKPEFEATTDPGGFVGINGSIITYADNYFSKERIQIAQKDSIIAAGTGKVYGPYLDGGSYVLSRVVDSKVLPDSVKARHILISLVDRQTQQPIMSDSVGKARIDSIEKAIKGGADFGALAKVYSNDPGSAEKGGDLGYFASGTMVPEFNDFCFSKAKGALGVVKTQFGYHLIEVTDQKNFATAYKIAYLGRSIDPSMETVNAALNAANQFAGNSRTVKAFDDNAIKQNYTKLVIPDIRENDYVLMGLGTNRRMVKDIFEAKVGDVLEPVELEGKYVVAAITAEEKDAVMSVEKARPMVEPILRNKEKAKKIAEKIGKVTSLDAAATANNTVALRADSVSFVSPVISGAGYEPKVAGFAFNKKHLNKVSAPISGNSGLFLIEPLSLGAAANGGASLDDTKNSLRGQVRNSAMSSSMQALREKGKIKDMRSKFL